MSGIDKTTDAVLQRKIMLVNISALVAVGGTVVYAGIYLPRGVWGLTASALLQAVLAVFYCAVWPLNRRGFFRAARYHLFAVTMVFILGSIAVGQGTLLLSQYFFLLLGMVAVTFFKASEWRISLLLLLVCLGCFTGFEYLGWPAHPSVAAMPPETLRVIRVVKITTCVVVLMLVLMSTEVMMEGIVRQLDRSGRTDALTGLPNRRHFLAAVAEETAATDRRHHSGHRLTLALALVDIDHFKAVNDQYGHEVGDVALKHVTAQLLRHARSADTVARLGGEEFGVLMPVGDAIEALAVAECLRAGLASAPLVVGDAQCRLNLSISIGVRLWTPGMTPAALLRDADQAMYQAKRSGRNRVCLWRSAAETQDPTIAQGPAAAQDPAAAQGAT